MHLVLHMEGKMKGTKDALGDWLGDALDPVRGKKLMRFNYRKASKRREFDTLELHFSTGKVSICPDPTAEGLELAAWFTPESK
jgi:hypothetical protein